MKPADGSINEAFAERLKTIKGKESTLSFAKKSGLTEGALRSYLEGKSLPSIEKAANIAKIANVSLDWLITGKEEPLPLESNVSDSISLDIKIPLYDVTASAGAGSHVNFEKVKAYVPFSKEVLAQIGVNYKDVFALTVKGDSMEPSVKDEEMIFIDQAQQSLEDSKVFVISIYGNVFIKRIKQTIRGIEIISDNPAYKPEFFSYDEIKNNNNNFNILGRVIMSFQNL